MKGHILMSVKEADRIPTVEKLTKGLITTKIAAERLSLSTRQVKRLKIRFKESGVKGLIHKSRGRLSNRAIPEAETKRIMKIVKDKYPDFGPTLAQEKLKENHSIAISRETLRKMMITERLWKPKKKRYMKIFQIRERRSREGELEQMDGSPHPWFEEKGDPCTLLVIIDDATGKLKYLQFTEEETTNDYFRAMDTYITNFGKPLALYVDRHSVFKTTRFASGTGGADDSLKETQFTRAMRELSIEVICANSPQAKGRVEKVNDTLQDRLVKEMRLKGISNIQEGNKYLPEFIKVFNAKFAVEAKSKENAHRPLLPNENLKSILIKKEVRVLSKALTFQYKAGLYQVDAERPTYTMRHAPIAIHEDWSKNITAYYKGKKLNIRPVSKHTPTKVANGKELTQEMRKVVKMDITRPSENHPRRRFVYR